MSKGDLRIADEFYGVHRKDYCPECGCPPEICCERRGRVEELKRLLINDYRLTVEFIRERIKELEKGELK